MGSPILRYNLNNIRERVADEGEEDEVDEGAEGWGGGGHALEGGVGMEEDDQFEDISDFLMKWQGDLEEREQKIIQEHKNAFRPLSLSLSLSIHTHTHTHTHIRNGKAIVKSVRPKRNIA
jgi:hypothetical protein